MLFLKISVNFSKFPSFIELFSNNGKIIRLNPMSILAERSNRNFSIDNLVLESSVRKNGSTINQSKTMFSKLILYALASSLIFFLFSESRIGLFFSDFLS